VRTAPVAAAYTYAFVVQHLPKAARDILEIGCGNGELAARLLEDGLRVLALDSDEACVASARAAGVDAKVATWPTPVDQLFDAVLFTRSLHHITPLDEAIDAAVATVKPGGRIIVEDFRIELESPRTNAWFIGLMRLFDASGLFADPGTLDTLIEKLDFGEHRHELHSSVAVVESLRRHGVVHEEVAAYYFRYVEAAIAEPLTAALCNYELAMIEAGAIDALGARFVLTPSK
jgi:SAM-dependent methyltransferase